MKDVLKLKCDRSEWSKTHTLTEKERQEKIDDKVKKVYNQIKFNKRVKETSFD